MRIKITVFTLALSIAICGTLFAAEIYKSIDSEGNVNFSDIPTVGSERLAIRSRPTDPARVETAAQARVDNQTQEAEEVADAPQGPTAEERRAEARERAEKCKMYKDRQIRFAQNRRIYKMEDGVRVYYSDQEMQSARSGVDDMVRKYCN